MRRAILQALRWQREIESGNVTRADVARWEGLTGPRVTRIMKLLDLDEGVSSAILDRDEVVLGLTAKAAISLAG